MTVDEFYRQDVELAVAYRRADELRKARKNEELWLQGLYIYDAICAVAPILRAFSKARQPEPYLKEPIDIFGKNSKKENEPKQTEPQKAQKLFSAWAIDFNANRQKGGVSDGDRCRSGSDIDIGGIEYDSSEESTRSTETIAERPQQNSELGQPDEDLG